MKKVKSAFTNISLDNSSRSSHYHELNSDVQETKTKSKSILHSPKTSKTPQDSSYINFESSDLWNDSLSALRVDTPHVFFNGDSSVTIVMILAHSQVEKVYEIIRQPESYVSLSPHIVCVSFKGESIVITNGNEYATEMKKTKIKIDMTVIKKRLFFWRQVETLDGYFLVPHVPPTPTPAAAAAAPPSRFTTSLRSATPFSLPKMMEVHTQDQKGGEVRYQYLLSDHPEGTKITCKVTEERRVVLQSSSRAESSSGGGGGGGAAFHKARSRLLDFFSKSKLKIITEEQKVFLHNFKDHIRDLSSAPTRVIV